MCAVCMQILSLYVYMQNFICALAHVLCILSPRPQVIVTDVKLREGKKKQGCRGAYPGRTQRTKAQSTAALWGCVNCKGSLLLQRSGGETLSFQQTSLTGHWFLSKHCMFMDPDISTGNLCIQITAKK